MATGRALSSSAIMKRLYLLKPHSADTSLSHSYINSLACQGRHGKRLLSSHSTRKTPSYAQVFTLSDIPLSSFEGVIARNGDSFKDLSPEQYYGVAQKFSEAIRRGTSPWTASFTDRDTIPAETLHQVACIMRQIAGTRSADAFATALWSTASEMGYRPSTLSLARQLIHSRAYSRIPQLRRVEARFKGLVSSGKDANALTAEGELLLAQGRADAAAAALKRALTLSDEFEWRPHCQLCLGRAYLKMGQADEARRLFEKLAEEGVVEADAELAEMLHGSDADEARQRMYTAACNGRRDMFTRLSEMELEKLESGKDTAETRLWAMEWSKLADGQVEH
ncbi:hypothetical protein ED733_001592 [Metarhizium rileyi]|uniref:Uncharacterized protein n=1 Tax=Metarhizium rileyi (strain RCEF 4871) TaxID=1649241 RepID=A0A5C6GKI1_METRR|nr:hypothetical protein ED733_001592 [Metarhizium rileyi]